VFQVRISEENTLNATTQPQGRRQRGGKWCPALSFEICAPPFHVWPPGCCLHPIQYF